MSASAMCADSSPASSTPTSNEELESANEELTTLNEELATRNTELRESELRLREQAELLELAKVYDVILLDLGAGVEHHVRSLCQIAARCLVVVTDEPTSMTDAYAFIKLASAQEPRPEMQIVVNQATTQKEGERTYAAMNKACSTFLKFSPPLAGIIRRDPKVKDAIRNQKPLVVRSPSSTAATDTAALSVKLMVRN